MGTPCECLERVVADVAPYVPNESVLHVEVEFDQQPLGLRFVSTPYDRTRLYDLSLRTPFEVPPELANRVRKLLADYLALTQPLLKDELVFLRVSVTPDGSFLAGQSCRQASGRVDTHRE